MQVKKAIRRTEKDRIIAFTRANKEQIPSKGNKNFKIAGFIALVYKVEGNQCGNSNKKAKTGVFYCLSIQGRRQSMWKKQ